MSVCIPCTWYQHLPEYDNENDNASDEERDDHHEAENLLLQRCHASLRVRSEFCNASKNRIITSRNANA